jgi:hypothetical protein
MVKRYDASTMGTCLCTTCHASLAESVGLADDSSPVLRTGYRLPPVERLDVPEAEQNLTRFFKWVEESEEDAKERKKKTKATKKKSKRGGGRRGKKSTTQLQEEEDEEADSGMSGAYVAAAVMVSVLETMEREKNGQELNKIELKALRQGVAVTGGRTSIAGWDESFASQVAKLTGDRPQLSINIISSVRTTSWCLLTRIHLGRTLAEICETYPTYLYV